jgi:hypothetical protein
MLALRVSGKAAAETIMGQIPVRWTINTKRTVQRVTLTVMAHEFGEVTHSQELIGRLAG